MDSAPPTPLIELPPIDEDWLDSLPEEHRDRVLAERRDHEARWEELQRQAKYAWRKPVLHATLLMVCTAAFVTNFDLLAVVASLATGALVGWLWHVTRSGILSSPVITVPLFLFGLLLADALNPIAFIWAPAPLAVFSAWLGLRRGELPGSG